MGTKKHHSVIVVAVDFSDIKKVRDKALVIFENQIKKEEEANELFGANLISPIVSGLMSGAYSFFYSPRWEQRGVEHF